MLTIHERLLDGQVNHWSADMRLWRGQRWVPTHDMVVRTEQSELVLSKEKWTWFGAAVTQHLAIGLHSRTKPNSYRDGDVIAIVTITAERNVSIRPIDVPIVYGNVTDSVHSGILQSCIALLGYSVDGTFNVHLRDFTVPEIVDEDLWRFRVDRPRSDIPSLWLPGTQRNRFQNRRRGELLNRHRAIEVPLNRPVGIQTDPPSIVDMATQFEAPPPPEWIEPSADQRKLLNIPDEAASAHQVPVTIDMAIQFDAPPTPELIEPSAEQRELLDDPNEAASANQEPSVSEPDDWSLAHIDLRESTEEEFITATPNLRRDFPGLFGDDEDSEPCHHRLCQNTVRSDTRNKMNR